jgi:hypothetical protein
LEQAVAEIGELAVVAIVVTLPLQQVCLVLLTEATLVSKCALY